MRQILYLSSSTVPGDGADLQSILEQSRHNNAIDGVTGLLWSDGLRFLQVLEGPKESIALTWERIRNDPRHNNINVLHDTPIVAREFGYWSMAYRRKGESADVYNALVRRQLANVSAATRQPFLEMISSGDGL